MQIQQIGSRQSETESFYYSRICLLSAQSLTEPARDPIRLPVGGVAAAGCDASRIEGSSPEVEVTDRFAGAHGRLVSPGRTIGRVLRRAQRLAIVQIQDDPGNDEEAVLGRTDRLSARRDLGNSRSAGMKGSLKRLIDAVSPSLILPSNPKG